MHGCRAPPLDDSRDAAAPGRHRRSPRASPVWRCSRSPPTRCSRSGRAGWSSLPVAILLGPWSGVVAAAIADSGTSPPSLLVIGLLEALVVGAARSGAGIAAPRRRALLARRSALGSRWRRGLFGAATSSSSGLRTAAAPERHGRRRAGRPARRLSRAVLDDAAGRPPSRLRCVCLPRLRARRRRAGAHAQRRPRPRARRSPGSGRRVRISRAWRCPRAIRSRRTSGEHTRSSRRSPRRSTRHRRRRRTPRHAARIVRAARLELRAHHARRHRGMLVTTTRRICRDAELRRRGIGDRPYFQQALAHPAAHGLAGRHLAHGRRRPVILITSPYLDRRRDVAGAVCGVLPAAELADAGQRSRAPCPMPRDHRRRVRQGDLRVGRLRPQRSRRTCTTTPLLRPPQRARRPTSSPIEAAGRARAASSSPWRSVPGTGWRVFVEHSLAGLRLQTTQLLRAHAAARSASPSAAACSPRVASRRGGRIRSKTSSRWSGTSRCSRRRSRSTPAPASLTEIRELVDDVQPHAAAAGRFVPAAGAGARPEGQLNRELQALTADLDRKVRERTAELLGSDAHGQARPTRRRASSSPT